MARLLVCGQAKESCSVLLLHQVQVARCLSVMQGGPQSDPIASAPTCVTLEPRSQCNISRCRGNWWDSHRSQYWCRVFPQCLQVRTSVDLYFFCFFHWDTLASLVFRTLLAELYRALLCPHNEHCVAINHLRNLSVLACIPRGALHAICPF